MKKTIVAAAVAALVAAPAAFADVSVSGNVFAEIGDNNGEQDEVFTDLYFKSSEDLGNGMKVATSIQLVGDNASTGSTTTANAMTGDRIITLSGDFGTIQAGRFEAYVEGNIMSMAATDPAHTITIEGGVGNAGSNQGKRYTSPSFSGVKVIAESFAAGESTVAVEYSNAGLTIKAASESGTDATANDSMVAQYKMGDLMARVVYTEDDAGNEQTFIGGTYTMGANTIGYGLISDATEAASGAQADLNETEGDYTVSLNHQMSKSTNAYIAHFGNDDGDDETVVGIKHKF